MVMLLAVELVEVFLLPIGYLVSGDLLAVGLVLVVLLAVQLILLGLRPLHLDQVRLEAVLCILGCLLKTGWDTGSPGKRWNLKERQNRIGCQHHTFLWPKTHLKVLEI